MPIENLAIDCTCHHHEHTVLFRTWTWDSEYPPELEMVTYLKCHDGFWQRLKTAVQYLFGGRAEHGHFDTVEISAENAALLVHTLNKYQQMAKDFEGRAL